ncbi:MAG TPA: hypothetical protein V6D31_07350, partial [Candidatus Sericytochromatia bacterium]
MLYEEKRYEGLKTDKKRIRNAIQVPINKNTIPSDGRVKVSDATKYPTVAKPAIGINLKKSPKRRLSGVPFRQLFHKEIASATTNEPMAAKTIKPTQYF